MKKNKTKKNAAQEATVDEVPTLIDPLKRDYLLTCIDPLKNFTMRFVSLKNVVTQTLHQKKLTDSLGLFLAECLLGSVLLGTRTSEQESTLFKYVLTSPDMRVNCEVSPVGALRCAVFPAENRKLILPEWLDGSLNVAVMNQDKEVYESIIEFKQSSAVEIFAEYTAMSRQSDCIMLINGDTKDLSKNYGLVIEKLPDAPEDGWQDFQDRFADGQKFMECFQNTDDPDVMLRTLFDQSFKVLKVLFPALTCSCNQERFLRALEILPKEDLMELFVSNQGITSQCEYCQKIWEADDTTVRRLLGMTKNVTH